MWYPPGCRLGQTNHPHSRSPEECPCKPVVCALWSLARTHMPSQSVSPHCKLPHRNRDHRGSPKVGRSDPCQHIQPGRWWLQKHFRWDMWIDANKRIAVLPFSDICFGHKVHKIERGDHGYLQKPTNTTQEKPKITPKKPKKPQKKPNIWLFLTES